MKGNNPGFQFQRFTVRHDKCAMKVGTDGVLIGAWGVVKDVRNALDVGCGSGLIALMLAQRNDSVKVLAVDIDADAVAQANENFQRSPFADRLKAIECDFRNPGNELEEAKYELVVCNPPFHKENVLSSDCARMKARSVESLPFADLLRNSARYLSPGGRFAIVVPAYASPHLILDASMYGLRLLRRADVFTTPEKPPKRILLEFTNEKVECPDTHIIYIYDENGHYSEKYRQLTKEFYLNL